MERSIGQDDRLPVQIAEQALAVCQLLAQRQRIVQRDVPHVDGLTQCGGRAFPGRQLLGGRAVIGDQQDVGSSDRIRRPGRSAADNRAGGGRAADPARAVAPIRASRRFPLACNRAPRASTPRIVRIVAVSPAASCRISSRYPVVQGICWPCRSNCITCWAMS